MRRNHLGEASAGGGSVLEHQSDWPGHGQVLEGYLRHRHALSEQRPASALPTMAWRGYITYFSLWIDHIGVTMNMFNFSCKNT